MIVIFNQGMLSELSYIIDFCGETLEMFPTTPDEDDTLMSKEVLTISKPLSINNPEATAKSTFSQLLDSNYVIKTITLLNKLNEVILRVENYKFYSCKTQFNYTNQHDIGKFAIIKFIK